MVAAQPAHHLEYRAISRGADVLTHYTMELFQALPTLAAYAKIDASPMNKWLDEHEIRRMEANDGRPVSASVGVILELAHSVRRPWANNP